MGACFPQFTNHDKVMAPKPAPMIPKVNHETSLPRAAGETFSDAVVAEDAADEVMEVEVEDVVESAVEEPVEEVAEEAAEALSNAGWKSSTSPEGSCIN